jgi:hypothetical protein
MNAFQSCGPLKPSTSGRAKGRAAYPEMTRDRAANRTTFNVGQLKGRREEFAKRLHGACAARGDP